MGGLATFSEPEKLQSKLEQAVKRYFSPVLAQHTHTYIYIYTYIHVYIYILGASYYLLFPITAWVCYLEFLQK